MPRTSKHTSSNRHLLIHAAGIAAVVAFAGGIWKANALLSVQEMCLRDELQSVTDLTQRDREIRAQHERLEKEIQLLHETAQKRAAKGSVAPNDASVLADLSKLANNVQLSIKSYSPGQASANSFQAQISATGSYAGICRFLNELSATSFLCQVTQCSLAAPQEGDGICALELTLRVVNATQVHATLAATGSAR